MKQAGISFIFPGFVVHWHSVLESDCIKVILFSRITYFRTLLYLNSIPIPYTKYDLVC
jgi:hypothetical protein